MDSKDEALTILGLQVENVRCLKVISLRPEATGVVTISGRNCQGKSSILDAIQCALSGKAAQPAEPIRKGETSAVVVADLGGKYTVRRTWSAKGTFLTVEAKQDGASLKVARPQEFLDTLVGTGIGFDPLAFWSRKKPEEQVQMLLDVLQLPEDPRVLDRRRQEVYEERTDANKLLKMNEAILQGIEPVPEGTPDEEVSLQSLLDELERRQADLRKNGAFRASRDRALEHFTQACARVEELTTLLAQARVAAETAQITAESSVAEADACLDPNLDEVTTQIQGIENTNRTVRAKIARTKQEGYVKVLSNKADDLTIQIEEIDRKKRVLLSQAKLPIPGIAIEEVKGTSRVTYRGITLADCSSSEKLRVSLALAMALSPKVRVLLVREGSLLDEEARGILEQVAEQNGVQVWLEQVSTDPQGKSFVIEQGEVKDNG